FFQAEDGIRDFHVTGVQTCALPISVRPARMPVIVTPKPPAPALRRRERSEPSPISEESAPSEKAPASEATTPQLTPVAASAATRSEERRVGKECRCEWWPYNERIEG